MASKRSSSGEANNTGLIVALVFFVLATLGLGVGTYMGYAGKSEAEKQAKAANDAKTQADKKAREEQAQKLAVLIATGSERDADRQTFNGLKAEFPSQIQTQLATLKYLPQWNPLAPNTGDRPPKTYASHVEDLEKSAKAAVALQQAKEAELEEEKRKAAEAIQSLETKLKTTQDNLKKANDAVVAAQSAKSDNHDALSVKVKEQSEQLSKLSLEKQNQEADLLQKIKELQVKLDTFSQVREAFRGRVGPVLEKLEHVKNSRPELTEVAELYDMLSRQFEPVKSVANDTPKGEIVRIDRTSKLVYINLGSADFVRPGLTFSVLPAGSTGKAAASRERKGAIEVVTVMDPHLSSAKVVDYTNELRDPLLRGDLLFNPAWSSNQRMHIAIAGIIDLNGDGIDDSADLMRSLQRQGIVVDAYLDLKDRTIKGPGMTVNTMYLILGERPVVPTIAQENNPITAAAIEVLGKIDEMKSKANELGVETPAYRRFLSLIGYRLPKTMQPADYSQSSYLKGLGGAIKKPDEGKDDRPK